MGKAIHTGLIQEECMTGVCDLFNPMWVCMEYPPKHGEGTYIDTGVHLGVNAFNTIDELPQINTTTTNKINIRSKTAGALSVTINNLSSTQLLFNTSAGSDTYVMGGKQKTTYFALTPDGPQYIEFETSNITTSFSSKFIPAQEEPIVIDVMTAEYSETGIEIQWGADVKTYEFDVKYDGEGIPTFNLNFTISVTDGDSVAYSIVNKETGEVLYESRTMGTASRELNNIPSGTYYMHLQTYGSTGADAGRYTTINLTLNVDLSVKQSTEGMIRADDDDYTTANIIDLNSHTMVKDWVGSEDSVDWFEITNFESRAYTFNFNVIQGGSTVSFMLYENSGSRNRQVASSSTKTSTSFTYTPTIGNKYYLKVSCLDDGMYTIQIV